MKKFRFVLALIGLTSMLSANADSITSSLDIISSPSIGSGTLGVVTITQNSFDSVGFNVTLAPDTAFVSTGGPHHAFAFNTNLLAPYTVTFNSPINGMFVYSSGSGTNTPYGLFSGIIDCPGCGPGASNAYSGVLDFTITSASGISLSNFIANLDGYFFSADVIGPSGGTGNIAADLVTPVPEPQTYAMILAGLALVGFTARRRKEFTD